MDINKKTISKFKDFPAVVTAYEYYKSFRMEDAHPEFLHYDLPIHPWMVVPKLVFWDKYLIDKNLLYLLVINAFDVRNYYKGSKFDFTSIYQFLNDFYPQFNYKKFNTFYKNYTNYQNYKEDICFMFKYSCIEVQYKRILSYFIVLYNDIDMFKKINMFQLPPYSDDFIINDCDNFIDMYDIDKENVFLKSIYYNSHKIINKYNNLKISIDIAYELYKLNYKKPFKIRVYFGKFIPELLDDISFLDYLYNYAIIKTNIIDFILNGMFNINLNSKENKKIITNSIFYYIDKYNVKPKSICFNSTFKLVEKNYNLAKKLHKTKIKNMGQLTLNDKKNCITIFDSTKYKKYVNVFGYKLKPKDYNYVKSLDQFNFLVEKNIKLPKNLNKLLKSLITFKQIDLVEVVCKTGLITKLDIDLLNMCKYNFETLECIIHSFNLSLFDLDTFINECLNNNSQEEIEFIMQSLSYIYSQKEVEKYFELY
jgi:hypothetical protein